MAVRGVPVYMCPDALGCGFVRKTTREELEAMDTSVLSHEVIDGVNGLFEGLFGIKL